MLSDMSKDCRSGLKVDKKRGTPMRTKVYLLIRLITFVRTTNNTLLTEIVRMTGVSL